MWRRAPLPFPSGRKTLTVLALSVFAVTGCEVLTSSQADRAEIFLEGPNPDTVQVITSQDFIRTVSQQGGGTELAFIESDTAIVQLPFDQAHALRDGWFAVRVQAIPNDTVEVNLRVLMDGSERFNETSLLSDQHMQFFVTHN